MGIYKWPREYNFSTETWYMSKDKNHYLTEHFRVWEFASHDGADEVIICPELLLHCLEPLYKYMNAKAINITSGYRTVAQSIKIGSSGATDNHHLGMAADIQVKKQDGSFYSPQEICCALEDIGWNGGIGYMKTAVHVDTGTKYNFDETKKGAVIRSWYDYWGINKAIAKPNYEQYKITTDWLYLRTRASTVSLTKGKVYKGDIINVVSKSGTWYKLDNGLYVGASKYSVKVN